MRAHRTLRSRLFTWFVGAILLAIVTGSLVGVTTRPEPFGAAEAMAQNLAAHFASVWDDADATRMYIAEIRDVTGFDARLLRDPRRLSPRIRRVADRGGAFVPDGPQHVFIPVLRGGALIGAIEIERFGSHAATWGWGRFALALGLVVAVLSAMARAVADQLARPLERLALAADRFGGGDLSVRTDVAGSGQRWVAREVRDVGVRFNRMAERVEAMVRGQRELLGAISHELRSPLGRARVALEIARDRLAVHGDAASAANALDDVEAQLGAIDAILGDLLDVTRSGLADLRKETVGFGAFVEWLRAMIAEEPSPPPMVLGVFPAALGTAVVGAEPDMELAFDRALLARVVHNLLLNARAHGHPADRAIEVRVERPTAEALEGRPDGPWVRVVVRDRGPGFPAGLAQRAFEPFVRGDAARARPREGAGYGFGLAIVRRIVEAHGGRVFARSRGPDGSQEAAGRHEGDGSLATEQGGGAEVGFDLPMTTRPR